MSYWPEDDSGSHWQGHYDGEPQEHATNGDHKLGNGYYKNGGYENGGYENGGYENGGGGGYYENGGGTYENGYGGLRGRRGGRGSKRWAWPLCVSAVYVCCGRGARLQAAARLCIARRSSQSNSWTRGLSLNIAASKGTLDTDLGLSSARQLLLGLTDVAEP